jgi:hypothetical protein
MGFLQDRQMLADGLPRHVHFLAERVQRLPVPGMETVQQLPAARIGQCPKDCIHAHTFNMQPYGCLSSAMPDFLTAAATA